MGNEYVRFRFECKSFSTRMTRRFGFGRVLCISDVLFLLDDKEAWFWFFCGEGGCFNRVCLWEKIEKSVKGEIGSSSIRYRFSENLILR